jgi:lysyl-tRNA synthetase class 1
MQWLNKIVDEIESRHPGGEILVESGGSPSGTHHLGHLRELITADAVLLELQRRGRQAKHIYYVDDLDALRKVPVNIPTEYEQYLGKPLCDIPAPDGSDQSYGAYFIKGLIEATSALGMEIEFIFSHERYRSGFFVPAIEQSLEHLTDIRNVLETISGHQLGEEWSPIQINEAGYLKKRKFVDIDTAAKTLRYLDKDGNEQTVGYETGEVKLDWRIDWPARWWLLKVSAEPFGRDHATKGGSYDTGAALSAKVFDDQPPLPIAYDFVNMAGDTKKMSASKGTGLDAEGVVHVLPPEIVRFFMLRYPPSKRLYFDPQNGVAQLIDEFAELINTEPDNPLLYFCQQGIQPVVSRIPFSHLVASYQAALRDTNKTLQLLRRTGHDKALAKNEAVVVAELRYIDNWLKEWAPEDSKFELREQVDAAQFSDDEKAYLSKLAAKVAEAPDGADGEWFHKAIYDLKESMSLDPKSMFSTLYRALIGKDSGPRAGWFLSILPRDWLIARLKFEA